MIEGWHQVNIVIHFFGSFFLVTYVIKIRKNMGDKIYFTYIKHRVYVLIELDNSFGFLYPVPWPIGHRLLICFAGIWSYLPKSNAEYAHNSRYASTYMYIVNPVYPYSLRRGPLLFLMLLF